MSIHYVKDLPGKIHLTEPPGYKPFDRRHREIMLDQKTFDSIGDYTRSMPTGASAGRIWKRNLGWPDDVEDNWFVHLVVDAPDGDGQLHVPYKPVIV